jgi:hypothetical protein
MGDINPLKVPGRKPAKKLAKGGSVTALDKLVKAERATSRMGK